MRTPRFTLVTDGPTDGVMLIPILEWLLRGQCPGISIKIEYADHLRRRVVPKGLDRKIAFALANYPCECLFVHRDAEKEPPDNRREEVRQALDNLAGAQPEAYICVVPVRMSEAWLLLEERAIRLASGNPNGKVPLDVPRRSDVESLPDPKAKLYELLTTASELTGRRRKAFDPKSQARRVADLIDDFSQLRGLPAFQALEEDVERLIRDKGWDQPS